MLLILKRSLISLPALGKNKIIKHFQNRKVQSLPQKEGREHIYGLEVKLKEKTFLIMCQISDEKVTLE